MGTLLYVIVVRYTTKFLPSTQSERSEQKWTPMKQAKATCAAKAWILFKINLTKKYLGQVPRMGCKSNQTYKIIGKQRKLYNNKLICTNN